MDSFRLSLTTGMEEIQEERPRKRPQRCANRRKANEGLEKNVAPLPHNTADEISVAENKTADQSAVFMLENAAQGFTAFLDWLNSFDDDPA